MFNSNINLQRVVLWTSILFFTAIIVCNIFSCTQCKQLSQRCFNNQLQLCDTRGRWRTVANCKQIYTIKDKKHCKCVCNTEGHCNCEAEE